jgi:hypothetical protein
MPSPDNNVIIVTDAASYYQASSGTMVGIIYISVGPYRFPSAGWTDFPAPVLASWLEEIANAIIVKSDCVKLQFLDGTPFARVAVAPEKSVSETTEHGCDVLQISMPSFADLLKAVIIAGEICLDALTDGRDREMLRVNIGSARRLLDEIC